MTPDALDIVKKYKGDGLAIGIEAAQEIVDEYVTNPTLHENQISALVSLVDNIGSAAFLTSDLLYMVNKGHIHMAADEFNRWVLIGNKESKSMKTRRKKERKLFLTPCLVVNNKKAAK